MQTINESMLKPISIGYVLENKLRDTSEIEIILSEVNPFVSGELVAGAIDLIVDGTLPDGSAQNFKIQTSNAIRATWMGDGSNRISAPDVRRGERVEVLQYSNTDHFYWRPYATHGTNVRKLETHIEAWSNTKDESQTELNADNSWYREVSTHDKTITIKTNKSDGEQWAYTVQLDAKKGNVVVADDLGNYFQLNSDNQTVEAGTAAGGFIGLLKNVLKVKVDKVEMEASTGNFKIGEMSFDGLSTFMQGTTFKGTSDFGGASNFTQTIMHQGVNIGRTHYHDKVQSGGSNSGQVKG